MRFLAKQVGEQYTIKAQNRRCTKHSILSEIARIYDPLSFLAPLTLMAKQLIQTLWSTSIGWDDTPPSHIVNLLTPYLLLFEFRNQFHSRGVLNIKKKGVNNKTMWGGGGRQRPTKRFYSPFKKYWSKTHDCVPMMVPSRPNYMVSRTHRSVVSVPWFT